MTVADVDGVKIAGVLFDAGTDQLADADGGRPDRLVRRATPPTRRRCTTCSSASAAPASARRPPAWWSTATTSSATTCGSGAPTTAAASAGPSTPPTPASIVNGDDVTDVRPVRRALPEVPDDLERQRRPDVLLPERDAVRPAQPGRLDERLHAGLRRLQGRRLRHQPPGLGPRQLLLLQRQPGRGRRARLRGAEQRRTCASRTW